MIHASQGETLSPFAAGAMVIVSLQNPREKYWGALLELNAVGVSLRGVDLNSVEDFATMLRSDDDARPSILFFPSLRIERIELDQREGEFPSVTERFEQRSGRRAEMLLKVGV